MPSRMHASSAPNEREQEILHHVVTAQRELEAALGKLRTARRQESKSFQRKTAYGRMSRDLTEAANRLARIRGTHHIQDDPEVEPYHRPEKEIPLPPVASQVPLPEYDPSGEG